MTKEEFLNGFGFTPAEQDRAAIRKEWAEYHKSAEGIDERVALAEMDCQDGPLAVEDDRKVITVDNWGMLKVARQRGCVARS